jgi:hypothetical protein
MDSLGSILPKVLRKRGLYGHAAAAQVTFKAQQWITAALPGVASYLEVTHLKDGVLTIAAQNSIASQECLQMLPSLREYLARECKGAVIRDIRLERAEARKNGLA